MFKGLTLPLVNRQVWMLAFLFDLFVKFNRHDLTKLDLTQHDVTKRKVTGLALRRPDETRRIFKEC